MKWTTILLIGVAFLAGQIECGKRTCFCEIQIINSAGHEVYKKGLNFDMGNRATCIDASSQKNSCRNQCDSRVIGELHNKRHLCHQFKFSSETYTVFAINSYSSCEGYHRRQIQTLQCGKICNCNIKYTVSNSQDLFDYPNGASSTQMYIEDDCKATCLENIKQKIGLNNNVNVKQASMDNVCRTLSPNKALIKDGYRIYFTFDTNQPEFYMDEVCCRYSKYCAINVGKNVIEDLSDRMLDESSNPGHTCAKSVPDQVIECRKVVLDELGLMKKDYDVQKPSFVLDAFNEQLHASAAVMNKESACSKYRRAGLMTESQANFTLTLISHSGLEIHGYLSESTLGSTCCIKTGKYVVPCD